MCAKEGSGRRELVRPLHVLHGNSDGGFLALSGKYPPKLYCVRVGFDLRARKTIPKLAVANTIPTDWKLVC